MVPRLQERYRKEVVPEMMKLLGYKSPMQAPRLRKIVVDKGTVEEAMEVLKTVGP